VLSELPAVKGQRMVGELEPPESNYRLFLAEMKHKDSGLGLTNGEGGGESGAGLEFVKGPRGGFLFSIEDFQYSRGFIWQDADFKIFQAMKYAFSAGLEECFLPSPATEESGILFIGGQETERGRLSGREKAFGDVFAVGHGSKLFYIDADFRSKTKGQKRNVSGMGKIEG
jgi:hypothetical protein